MLNFENFNRRNERIWKNQDVPWHKDPTDGSVRDIMGNLIFQPRDLEREQRDAEWMVMARRSHQPMIKALLAALRELRVEHTMSQSYLKPTFDQIEKALRLAGISPNLAQALQECAEANIEAFVKDIPVEKEIR